MSSGGRADASIHRLRRALGTNGRRSLYVKPVNCDDGSAVLSDSMEEELASAARRLASLRRVYRKTCPVCGTEFEGIAKRVYDRQACRVKAYRRRRKARETGRAKATRAAAS